ncbi:DUF2357 domain-containing protein [Hujiaoplasma nucleasis]|uniref:DUF2357 domain-containing protein n=1 Tax=Hujiaoplasma nucleasis TaxID=2725268 RepID=A0A7L6N1P4_9MOLU|nr:DUF2357 domain-containing protein [Hujiaoplasma nucleasis]QLY40083.1 DUF2357 domain-containing protein [Hujiaoplasma nucleasis]
MKEGTAKRYYKKLNTTIEGLNKVDEFAKQFRKLLNSSDMELYQKERREKRVFDDSWMDEVEDIIPIIDKLTRNPRESLKKVSEVVAVERAKKIDSDTIRHLAANTQNIKERDRFGNVIPSKVLTSYYDQDLGTYENRFLMSLVNKLFTFIELRYNLIVEKMHTEYANVLNVKSKLEWEKTYIDYDISLNIHRDIDDDEMGQKNQELLERMTEVRKAITNYKMSHFMQEMKGFPPVRSPIMMTNIIRKNVDFNKCYNLWVTLDRVDRVGYESDVFDRDVLLDKKYEDQLKEALMILYATVSNSQIEDLDFARPLNYLREKKAKVLQRIDKDQYLQAGEYLLEDHTLNQYFLDKIKEANTERFKTLKDAGIAEEESIKIVYRKLQEIADNAFVDFIESNYKPDEIDDIHERIKVQRQVMDVYRDIEKVKAENNKDFKTNKALALLNLKNYRDELKAIEEAKKQKQREIEEEERRQRLAALDEKAREEVLKQEKIQEAKRILEEAKKERQKKKNK